MVSIESVRVHVYCQHYIFFIHFFITKGFIRTLSAPSPFVVGIGTVRAEMADNTVSIGEDRRLRKASVKVLNSLRGVAAFRRFDKIAHHSEMQEDMLREMFFSYDSIHNGRLAVADLYELLRMVRTSGGASQSLASIAEVPDGKDEGLIAMIEELLPYYHTDGISFQQFVFVYNRILEVDKKGGKQKLKRSKRSSTTGVSNSSIMSPVTRNLVMKEIDRLYETGSISIEDKALLRSIGEVTFVHEDQQIDHERQVVELKVKLAGLIKLHSQTKSKMMRNHIFRELNAFRGAKELYEECLEQRQHVKANKKILHGQLYKHTSSHTLLVPGQQADEEIHYSPFDDEKINYHGIANVAKFFTADDNLEKLSINLTPEIKIALIEHIKDMCVRQVLPQDLSDFAVGLVKKEDMYATFAFYKFVDHDESLKLYLKQRRGKRLSQKKRDRKKQHRKLLKRADSYKVFMQEKRLLYEDLQNDKAEQEQKEKEEKAVQEELPPKKKPIRLKKVPRWLQMFQEAKMKQAQRKLDEQN